jgi:LysM repeat protein
LLVNGVQVGTGSRYVVLDPTHAWATRETVDYLDHAYDRARKELPALPKLHVGHLSAKQGGRLSPHKSHQAGRDVDVGYFYTQGKQDWYRRATAENLDVARTWAFVRALLSETDVEYIFINGSVQKPLKDHALKIGEDPAWLDQVFQLGSRQGDAIIRHAKGHDTHIHVRFYNPVAQELGRRAYPVLVKRGQIKPRQSYLQHRAVKGDTLGYLARRYGTTVRAIQQANGLRGIGLQAKHVYLIPKEGKAAPVEAPPGPTRVPARRLPPSPLLPTAGSRSRG